MTSSGSRWSRVTDMSVLFTQHSWSKYTCMKSRTDMKNIMDIVEAIYEDLTLFVLYPGFNQCLFKNISPKDCSIAIKCSVVTWMSDKSNSFNPSQLIWNQIGMDSSSSSSLSISETVSRYSLSSRSKLYKILVKSIDRGCFIGTDNVRKYCLASRRVGFATICSG